MLCSCDKEDLTLKFARKATEYWHWMNFRGFISVSPDIPLFNALWLKSCGQTMFHLTKVHVQWWKVFFDRFGMTAQLETFNMLSVRESIP